MKKSEKKLFSRISGLCLAVSVGAAAVYFGGEKALHEARTASVQKEPYTPPVIVLDAGHGECC